MAKSSWLVRLVAMCAVTALTGGAVAVAPAAADAPAPPALVAVPATPPAPIAVAGYGQARVTVEAGHGETPTSFTVTTIGDDSKTCTVTGASGSCEMTGLDTGTAYTFTTIATNNGGASAPSDPSNAVTPTLPLTAAFESGGRVAASEPLSSTVASTSANGTITGTVSPVGGGALRSTVYMIALDSNRELASYGQVNTDTGEYTLGVLGTMGTGDYRLEFRDFSGIYLGEFYNDKTTFEEATPVSVVSGVETPGIDVELSLAGTITGTVSPAGGGALAIGSDIDVIAYDSDGEEISSGLVNAHSGDYSATGLGTGDFRLEFRDDANGTYLGEFYSDKATLEEATPVSVVAGVETPGIDVELSVAGTITGKVSQSGGGVLDSRSWVYARAYTSEGGYVASSPVDDATGEYTVAGLRTGDYRLEFQDFADSYLDEFYNDKPTLEEATPIAVTTGAATSGIDAELVGTGTITGTVSPSGGGELSPDSDTKVTAYNSDGDSVSSGSVDTATGEYTVGGLGTLNYRLQFSDSSEFYASEFYDDQATLTESTPVAVTTGEPTQNIDAQLSVAGTITGTVSPATGGQLSPDSDIDVTAYYSDGNYASSASVDTATGEYTVGGLGSRDYRLQFSDDGGFYASEFYNDRATLAEANVVVATAGMATSGIDAELTPAPPAPPAKPIATAGDGQATVSVAAGSVATVDSFKVYASPGGQSCTVTVPDASCDVTGLANGTAYTFTASATNDAGTSAASAASDSVTPVAPLAPPGVPVAPSAVAGNGLVTVSVMAGSGGVVDSFTVSASPGSATCTVTVPATSCVVRGLSDGSAYTFTATATNQAGTSAASAASRPATPTAPPAPPPPPPVAQVVAGGVTKMVKAKRNKKIGVPARTTAGMTLRWKSKSPKVCKMKGRKVQLTGKRGTCTLVATASATPTLLALSKRYKIRVK
jgi:hypothetical protein